MSNSLQILVVDDHPLVIEGLCALLDAVDTIEVAATAQTAHDARDLLNSQDFDVVLVDLQIGTESGAELAAEIKQRGGPPVLVLSAAEDPESITEAMNAGASGYLGKRTSLGLIVRAITDINAGRSFIDPALASSLITHEATKQSKAAASHDLSDRDVQIAGLVAKGQSNRAIASEMFLSERTVKNYVSQLLRALELENRTMLALWALDNLDNLDTEGT